MTENLMRNTLELDLSLCDYAFTNLSVGYRKRQSSLREFICEKGGVGGGEHRGTNYQKVMSSLSH